MGVDVFQSKDISESFKKDGIPNIKKEFKPNDISKYYDNQDQIHMSFEEFEQIANNPEKGLENALNDLNNILSMLKKDNKYLYRDFAEEIQNMSKNEYITEDIIKKLLLITYDINAYFMTKINEGTIVSLSQTELDKFFSEDVYVLDFSKKLSVINTSIDEKMDEVLGKQYNDMLNAVKNISFWKIKTDDIFMYVQYIKKGYISQENKDKVIQKASVMKFDDPFTGVYALSAVLSLNPDVDIQVQIIENNIHLIKTLDNLNTLFSGLQNKDVVDRFTIEYLKKDELLFLLYINRFDNQASYSLLGLKDKNIKSMFLSQVQIMENITRSFVENTRFSGEDKMMAIIGIIYKYGERMNNPKQDIIDILAKNNEIEIQKEKNINILIQTKQMYDIN